MTLVLWASAFVAIRHLAGTFSPGSLSLGRLLVGSLCLGAVALGRGLPRPTRGQWVSIVTIGVLWFGIYNVALNAGEQHVDAGTAVMLIQVSPVLVALLAAIVPPRAVHALPRPRPRPGVRRRRPDRDGLQRLQR